MSYFQPIRPDCKIESFYTTVRQKKIDCFSVDGICSHCKTVFEAMGCFYHFCPCQELRPSLTEQDFQRGSKKRELGALRRHYIQRKASRLLKCGNVNGGDFTRQPLMLKYISERISLQTVTYRTPTLGRNKEGKAIWLGSIRH